MLKKKRLNIILSEDTVKHLDKLKKHEYWNDNRSKLIEHIIKEYLKVEK